MKYEVMKKRAQKHADKIKEIEEIKRIWHSSDPVKKKIAFSKIALIFVFVDCLIIQFYSMWLMAALRDASSLSALIGIIMPIFGEVGSIISYNKKSSIENSANGIVYETCMKTLKDEPDDSVG